MMSKLLAVSLVRPDGSLRWFTGYVTEFSLTGSDAGIADTVTSFEIGSLHMGSIVGDVRIAKARSNRWLGRFDAASDAMQRNIEAAAAR